MWSTMTRTLCLLVLFALTGCGLDSPSSMASTERQEIGCSESYVAFIGSNGSFKCSKRQTQPGSAETPGKGRFQYFDFYGWADDGTWVSLLAFKTMDTTTGYVLYDGSPSQIQNYSDTTAAGTNWSGMRTISGAAVMDYTSSTGAKCFGFNEAGGASQGGYTYSVRGTFCRRPGAPPYSDAEIAEMLSRVIVR
jgi:hypothetical protein